MIKKSFFVALVLGGIFSLPSLVQAQALPPAVIPTVFEKRENNDIATNLYNKYKDLFDQGKSKLSFKTFSADMRNATDITFVLNAWFKEDGKTGWNKIANTSNCDENCESHRIFILRFCTVGTDGKIVQDSCAFSNWPYGKQVTKEDAITFGQFTDEEKETYLLLEMADNGHAYFPLTATNESGLNTEVQRLRVLFSGIDKKLKENVLSKKIYRFNSNITIKRISRFGIPFLDVDLDTENSGVNAAYGTYYKPTQFRDIRSGAIVQKNLTEGQRYQADVWYCAAGAGGLGDDVKTRSTVQTAVTGLETPPDPSNALMLAPEGFPCDNDHYAYVRLTGFQFTATTNQAGIDQLNQFAQDVDPNANAQPNDVVNGNDSVLPNCHILDGWGPGTGSFVGCLAFVVYYAIYWPIAWFAGIIGNLFDFFLGYSISDEAYRLQFIVEGWRLVRDISNIFFIVILVWTGFAAVFDIGSISMKKVVPTLIVNALIINFSLFATQIVVDISNVITRVFYNLMEVKNDKGEVVEIAGYKAISEVLVSAFDPQKIFDPKYMSEQRGLEAGVGVGAGDEILEVEEKQKPQNTNRYATMFIIISAIAAAVLLSVAVLFWKVAFFFLGRTIGIYIAMLFAPFAFLTRGNMPLLGGIKTISWSNWSKDLTSYALLAPIFIFFLYFVVIFATSDFVKVFLNKELSGGFGEVVIAVTVPMLIVYYLIKQGVGIAQTYAGMMGEMVQSNVEKITGGVGRVAGGALGVGAGIAAFAGRQTVGRGIRAIGRGGVKTETIDGKEIKTTRAQRWAANAKDSKWAMAMNAVQRGGQKGSFDLRNTKAAGATGSIFGKLAGTAGLTFEDKTSGKLGIDKTAGKGGVNATDKAWAESMNKRREELFGYGHLSDDEAKGAWEKYKAEQIKKYGETEWEKHLDDSDLMKTHKERVAAAEADAKAKREASSAAPGDVAKEQALKRAEQELKDAKTNLETERLNLVKNIKAGTAGPDADKKAKDAAEKAERDRLDKYGVARNAEALKKMMSGEYAYDLQNRSFWERQGPFGAFGMLGLSLGGLLGTVTGGALMGSFLESLAASVTGVDEEALKKQVKDGMKGSARANTYAQWKESLEIYDKKIVDLVNKHLKLSISKYGDANISQIDKALDKEIDELQVLIDDQYTPKLEKARAKRELKKIENLHKSRKDTQKSIDDHDKKEEEKKDKDKK